MCTTGTPMAEVCNGIDDDCASGVDNGPVASLCPPPSQVAGVMCNGAAGCSMLGCNSGFANVNGTYGDGCECGLGSGGDICGSAFSLGSLGVGGSASATGVVVPGAAMGRWYRVDFPPAAGGPGGGTPRITVSPSGFTFSATSSCGGAGISCGTGGATATSTNDLQFTDSSFAGETWATRDRGWPSSVYVHVTRATSATTCAAATFTITATR